MPVIPGEGYVVKDKDLAFCELIIDFKWMEEDLIAEWLVSSNTLEGWNELISTAQEKAKYFMVDGNNDLITTEVFDNHIEKRLRYLISKHLDIKREQRKIRNLMK